MTSPTTHTLATERAHHTTARKRPEAFEDAFFSMLAIVGVGVCTASITPVTTTLACKGAGDTMVAFPLPLVWCGSVQGFSGRV
jgi:hypothetical protein